MGQPKKKAERGRPTVFKKEYVEQAARLCELGATEREVAEFFKVTTVTLWRWKSQNPKFCNAFTVGKENSDNRVEASLYHRAVGYTFGSEKVFQFQGKIIRAKTLEHVPPDVGAATMWLKNRKPLEWREKPDPQMHVHLSLADLVNSSYSPDLPALPAPKTIEHEE